MPSLDTTTLPAGLYIVATPIGNLKDITLRALETLTSCNRVLCEDTRVTGKLLAAHNIEASMHVYNDHSTEKDRKRIIAQIEDGEAIALVSDAGTPLISDPGFKLVRELHECGLYVTTLPGASALPAALTLAGLPTDSFYFGGFLPSKSTARKSALTALKPLDSTLVFYERGSRVAGALDDAYATLGNCEARIVREISKRFEEVINITLDGSHTAPEVKGEVVLIIKPANSAWDDDAIETALGEALAAMRTRDAVDAVVAKSGATKNHVYELALKVRGGE